MSERPFDESLHPRVDAGQFTSRPATESEADLSSPVHPQTQAVHDQVLAAFPGARAVRVDIDITGSYLGDVLDKDGNALGDARDIPGLDDAVDDSMESDADSWHPVSTLEDQGAFDGGTFQLDIPEA